MNFLFLSRYGWKASNYTQFWGKSIEHGYTHKLGVKVPYPMQKSFSLKNDNLRRRSYDFRNEDFFNSNYNNLIKNQGNCAASWAYSTVDVIMDRSAKYKRKANTANPSVEMLISCIELEKN